MTLGVFGMVQGDETVADQVMQIKVNSQEVIRGEYYNATTDTTEHIAGAVDKNTTAGPPLGPLGVGRKWSMRPALPT